MASESPGSLNPMETPPSDPSATRARWVVLAFLCLLSGILYMDRICFSKAVKSIQDELHLTKEQISYVMMAFTLAYAVFEVPTGNWGDRRGTRLVLTRISLWWSFFTALTGACGGLWSLIGIRFLFGAGEAGAYPNSARILARWFPDSERGRAQGMLLSASQIGSMAAMPLAGYLVEYVGWRWMFSFFGALGVLWAVAFWRWFVDDPARHPAVSASELQQIGAGRVQAISRHERIPWRAVRGNYSIWLLSSIMICGAFNQYFYYSWFPDYLESARQVTNVKSGWLSSVPYIGTAIGTLCGGAVAGLIARRAEHRDRACCWFGGGAYAVAAACLWYAVSSDAVAGLVAFAALSCLCLAATLPVWWSCAIRISGRHVGSLFGLMNMVGAVGAMSSQYLVGRFTDWRKGLGYTGREQWDPVLLNVYVTMLIVGAACWIVYRSQYVEDRGAAQLHLESESNESGL
jgi:MFS family permease